MKTWVCSEVNLGLDYNSKFERSIAFMEEWSWCVRPEDTVYILGNLATNKYEDHDYFWNTDTFWFEWLSLLPGKKVYMLGSRDVRDYSFYDRYVDKVVSFHKFVPLKWVVGHKSKGENHVKTVTKQIMLSVLPADGVLYKRDRTKYLNIFTKFRKIFRTRKLGFVLNIHGHCRGRYVPRGAVFDVSQHRNLLTVNQIMEMSSNE